eukprot:6374857-Alexandrium_andersonii.AAC.1
MRRCGRGARGATRPLSTRHDWGVRSFDDLRQFRQDSRWHCLALPPALCLRASENGTAQLGRTHRGGRCPAAHEG